MMAHGEAAVENGEVTGDVFRLVTLRKRLRDEAESESI
jgi:hypothetical protein